MSETETFIELIRDSKEDEAVQCSMRRQTWQPRTPSGKGSCMELLRYTGPRIATPCGYAGDCSNAVRTSTIQPVIGGSRRSRGVQMPVVQRRSNCCWNLEPTLIRMPSLETLHCTQLQWVGRRVAAATRPLIEGRRKCLSLTVRTLIVSAMAKTRQTPLDAAIEYGNIHVADVLRKDPAT